VNLIKLFAFWNLCIALNLFAKIKKEEIICKIVELLGGSPILAFDKRTGKLKWRIGYVEKIIYK
jgi:hypothetical protein